MSFIRRIAMLGVFVLLVTACSVDLSGEGAVTVTAPAPASSDASESNVSDADTDAADPTEAAGDDDADTDADADADTEASGDSANASDNSTEDDDADTEAEDADERGMRSSSDDDVAEDDVAEAADGAATNGGASGEAIDWSPCGSLECATVTVPADYADADAGTIDIAVNILRASDPQARVGYLLVNPGGPGESGVEFVEQFEFFMPPELLAAFDVVGFDPRGVGASEPAFACGEGTEQFELLVQIDEVVDTAEEFALGAQAAQLCTDSMGPVGARLHSEFVARDIDEIRQALGADQISYLGFSYGSALGGWYASLFPDNVYSMVLDGADNPLANPETIDELVEESRSNVGPLYEQFEAAVDSCDTADCPIWNDGDPQGYFLSIVDKLSIVADARNGNNDAVVLGIIGHLYNQQQWPDLHQSIFDLGENDDPSGFLAAADIAGVTDQASVVAHVNCLDSWALFEEGSVEDEVARQVEEGDQVEAILEGEYPLFDAIDLPDQWGSCIFYDAIDPPEFTGTYDGGDIPILVVGNTSDPITPFNRSEMFANDVLSDGRLVRVSHPAHTVYPSNSCVVELVHAALIDADYPTDEVECTEERPGDLGEITLEPITFPDGATSLIPAGWIEITTGVHSQSFDPADPTLLVHDLTFGDIEGTLDFVAENFGVEPVSIGTVDFDGVTWERYEILSDGIGVRMGISPGDQGALILAQAWEDQIDRMDDEVLLPAMAAYQGA